jgi:hypothetical protein
VARDGAAKGEYRTRKMTPRRIKLADGTKLSVNFSKRVWDALDRAFWLEGLPPLRRNFIRFLASDGSIHDVPRRFISDALGIDQRWCYATDRQASDLLHPGKCRAQKARPPNFQNASFNVQGRAESRHIDSGAMHKAQFGLTMPRRTCQRLWLPRAFASRG